MMSTPKNNATISTTIRKRRLLSSLILLSVVVFVVLLLPNSAEYSVVRKKNKVSLSTTRGASFSSSLDYDFEFDEEDGEDY